MEFNSLQNVALSSLTLTITTTVGAVDVSEKKFMIKSNQNAILQLQKNMQSLQISN